MEQLILHLFGDYISQTDWMAKNKITSPSLSWSDASGTGYHKDDPAWLGVWLLIAADNTLHLIINYIALRWL